MMFQGTNIDGSWELHILVTDINQERTLRVKGDEDYIGGLMFKLVESLDIAMDWSDHAFWWPEKNMWLKHTRMSLDQCGVQADARLEFTPMHKTLKVQLPDLQVLDLPVDCSINVFQAVIHVCKELGIRRPEELSIMRKLTKDDLKKNNNKPMGTVRKRHRPHEETNNTHNNSTPSPSISMDFKPPLTPRGTGPPSLNSTPVPNSPFSNSMSSQHSLSFEGALESTLATSPQVLPKEGLTMLLKPKSFAEKARINSAWLDSSRSLYEQEVREQDLILLRFKLLSFYDLNPKYDIVRINQVYEQARWALISEEIDCTEEEMVMFAALQLQIQSRGSSFERYQEGTTADDDDIDRALNELQLQLEGGSFNNKDITRIPELSDYIRYARVKKYFGLKSFKRGFFIFRETNISMHRSQEEAPTTQATFTVSLKGCDVQSDVNIANQKYGIRLLVQDKEADGMGELLLRCENELQYTRWMAACRLAAQGKTMADASYESEIDNIRAFLMMQQPSQSPSVQAATVDFRPEDLVAPRFAKKLKTKTLSQRILEAQANVITMSATDAKMNFIKAWQALPEFGISYFIVKFNNAKKEELLGVAPNRLVRMDLNNGESLKTWRYSTMESWHVNWDVKQVRVQFEEEKVAFLCLTADCKVVHEFIGGYIFCSMRSSEKNQTLNEDMFHKLTGGWD